jgi:hypothetical protein
MGLIGFAEPCPADNPECEGRETDERFVTAMVGATLMFGL